MKHTRCKNQQEETHKTRSLWVCRTIHLIHWVQNEDRSCNTSAISLQNFLSHPSKATTPNIWTIMLYHLISSLIRLGQQVHGERIVTWENNRVFNSVVWLPLPPFLSSPPIWYDFISYSLMALASRFTGNSSRPAQAAHKVRMRAATQVNTHTYTRTSMCVRACFDFLCSLINWAYTPVLWIGLCNAKHMITHMYIVS